MTEGSRYLELVESLDEIHKDCLADSALRNATRADTVFRQSAAAIMELLALVGEMAEALEKIERTPRLPLIDMADDDAQQLRDVHNALHVNASIARTVLQKAREATGGEK